MITAQQALDKLIAGNKRFVADECTGSQAIKSRRDELASGQAPFAIVLSCADSRVPVEMIFDQGLGDLFVVRIAGNIAAPSQVGSIEFAVEQFDTPLIVVVGHSKCGAINATINALQNPGGECSPNLGVIVERICPQVEPLLDTELQYQPEELLDQSLRANVRAAVDHLRHEPVLEKQVNAGNLMVIGAHYVLETGKVEFFSKSS